MVGATFLGLSTHVFFVLSTKRPSHVPLHIPFIAPYGLMITRIQTTHALCSDPTVVREAETTSRHRASSAGSCVSTTERRAGEGGSEENV